jgi:hypothetical protein
VPLLRADYNILDAFRKQKKKYTTEKKGKWRKSWVLETFGTFVLLVVQSVFSQLHCSPMIQKKCRDFPLGWSLTPTVIVAVVTSHSLHFYVSSVLHKFK